MSFKSVLQGKWLGHPLHPAIVHLPTGLWPAALVFDLMSRTGGGNVVALHTATHCILLGLLAALLAIPTGLADFAEIKRGKPAWKLAIVHLSLNAIVFVLFGINLAMRINAPEARAVTMPQLALTIVAVALLFVSGYIGGRMVFDRGVSVARMSKQKWRRIAEQGKANVPQE